MIGIKHSLTLSGPGTNPLAVSPALAWLWAPVVRVSNVTSENSKTIQQDYTYQYTTLAMLDDTKSGLAVARSSDRLFAIDSHTELSGKLSPFGCFANLGGKTSECYNEHFLVCRQHFVYLLGVYGDGLQLARLPLHDIGKSESAYEFWQSEYCNFSLPGDSSKLLPSSKSYLQGSFSTGSVFYNPFSETFVLVYMNANADSTLYVRYLDLNIPLCAGNGTVWQKAASIGKVSKKKMLKPSFITSGLTRRFWSRLRCQRMVRSTVMQVWRTQNTSIDSTIRIGCIPMVASTRTCEVHGWDKTSLLKLMLAAMGSI